MSYGQLDFIGTIQEVPDEPIQYDLWNESGKRNKVRRDVDFSKVDLLFNSFDSKEVQTYKDYWQGVAPKNDTEMFQRWLFAFMSVHTTWEANVKGYEALKDWTVWFKDELQLRKLIVDARVGLHNLSLIHI